MLKTISTENSPRNGDVPITLQLQPIVNLDDDEFFDFCRLNPDLHIERTREGFVQIMTPAGGETSARNSILTTDITNWARRDGTGVVFDSSGGFILPNGAIRSPDVAWVRRTRLAVLQPGQKRRFLPLCPDFVVELRSATDSLDSLLDKMEEYRSNGVQLGWLIDPEAQRVTVYPRNGRVLFLDHPLTISGEPILPGLQLDLRLIWEPDF